MREFVRVRAHSKLTLALRVVDRRDDGFHEIDAVIASVGAPADTLVIGPAPSGEAGSSGSRLEVLGRVDGVPTDDSNLALRALRALVASGAADPGLDIRLHKAIPPGSGLGGGSADAAAVLAGASRAMEPGAHPDLYTIAATLGSDVPFCLDGGLARVTGRGERVDSLGFIGGWWVAVAVPDLFVPTAAVYAMWDELGSPRSDRIGEPPRVLAGVIDGLVNDLEPAALAVRPELGPFRDRWASDAGVSPVLAGSGSAYFVVTDDPVEAAAAADAARPFAALAEWSGPVPHGVEIED